MKKMAAVSTAEEAEEASAKNIVIVGGGLVI